ncbi:hypothetical protein PDESU_06443 [Pontiella desulfatans]|uniref:Methylamine utilisation protein MauE domain-containing protein n=1 Tax=Pontiella desulfatans TaxID=2750659 RepID=A0A6C2UEJ0_PONDE|nr:MauE/DoxX family redox-associated membrane protein [Pontiella desulfatans]VGO17841.1 hypothetical protein PDESU_06443 [Pontiella desulfatans]
MTRDQKTYRLAYWIASLIVAATWLSGYHKILHPADFALSVYRFHLLPAVLVNVVSLHIQWLEMVCAGCLLFIPKLRVAALWISLVLLALFTTGIAINLIRGTAFGCGCFGNLPTERPMDALNVARNLALMALVGLALFGKRKSGA